MEQILSVPRRPINRDFKQKQKAYERNNSLVFAIEFKIFEHFVGKQRGMTKFKVGKHGPTTVNFLSLFEFERC